MITHTMSTNAALMLPDNYTSRAEPSECLRTDETEYWNIDAYAHARKHRTGKSVCDLGCGNGNKSIFAFRFDVLGVDIPQNIDVCRLAHPGNQWIEADLNEGLPPVVDSDYYVLIDVIEHLVDPLPLLHDLRSRERMTYLSTPDRDLTHGINTLGPPPNTSHVREWTVSELYRLVQGVGFTVKAVELLPARIGHTKPTAIGMLLL